MVGLTCDLFDQGRASLKILKPFVRFDDLVRIGSHREAHTINPDRVIGENILRTITSGTTEPQSIHDTMKTVSGY